MSQPKLYFVVGTALWTLQDNVLEFAFNDCLAYFGSAVATEVGCVAGFAFDDWQSFRCVNGLGSLFGFRYDF
jgi:hypothetical protein